MGNNSEVKRIIRAKYTAMFQGGMFRTPNSLSEAERTKTLVMLKMRALDDELRTLRSRDVPSGTDVSHQSHIKSQLFRLQMENKFLKKWITVEQAKPTYGPSPLNIFGA